MKAIIIEINNDHNAVLQYPVTVVVTEGEETVVINNFQELFELLATCQE